MAPSRASRRARRRHRTASVLRSYADFVRRYRDTMPAADAADAADAAADAGRTRREFGWRPLTVVDDAAITPLQEREPAVSVPLPDAKAVRTDFVLDLPLAVPIPPPVKAAPPGLIDSDSDTDSGTDADWDSDADDLPDARPGSDTGSEVEEVVEEVKTVDKAWPPTRKKGVSVQRVDEAWVKAGLLALIGHGKLRDRLRSDVRSKITTEEVTGALRPLFGTNFTARFTATSCDTLHQFRQGIESRLANACWFCREANRATEADTNTVGPLRKRRQPERPVRLAGRSPAVAERGAGARDSDDTPHGGRKCMQLCQITQLDVKCRRSGDQRFLSIIGLADPVEGRRFQRACNDTCMEEWELLLQYGAAVRLRALLNSPAASVPTSAGLSSPVAASVRVRPVTRCPGRFELRYRLCYPIGSWAQRAVVDLEHTAAAAVVAAALGALLLLLCLAVCCYYRVLNVPRLTAAAGGWWRRRRLRWDATAGLERTDSGQYRRPSMVSTGAHGKQSRDEIRRTVDRWRRLRRSENRADGAPPRSVFSAVQMLRVSDPSADSRPPHLSPAAATDVPTDSTLAFSDRDD